MNKVTAYANVNFAVVKYWGKSSIIANLPAVPSISLTIDGLGTETTVSFNDKNYHDFTLNGVKQSGIRMFKVQKFVDILKAESSSRLFCDISSCNNVPISSGLASSASAFASLAAACVKIYNLQCSLSELSSLARQGSASAARSIYGGFVALPGGRFSKKKCYAKPIDSRRMPDICFLICVCAANEKTISSRLGMLHTKNTSSFYNSWVKESFKDFSAANRAIRRGDLDSLGQIMEYSTLKMHASMLSANPGFWFLRGATLNIMEKIKSARSIGIKCFFTLDAGPNVKILCKTDDAEKIKKEVLSIDGVLSVSIVKPGDGVKMLN